jgi:DNA repair photolyase
VELLSNAGVPVSVMMAPVIPGLNSHEILPLVKRAADCGALHVGHTMVRLNGAVADIFENWIRQCYPDRADKVLSQIADAHGGKLNDSRFGTRMRGQGPYADMAKKTMNIAREKYLNGRSRPGYNLNLFRRPTRNGQMDLFE